MKKMFALIQRTDMLDNSLQVMKEKKREKKCQIEPIAR